MRLLVDAAGERVPFREYASCVPVQTLRGAERQASGLSRTLRTDTWCRDRLPPPRARPDPLEPARDAAPPRA
jgi:hypothetical protein